MSEEEIKKCSRCGVEMEDFKMHTFRIGGLHGEWQYLFGDVAAVGESPLPLRVFICPKCGSVDLFADERTEKILLGRRGLKRCISCKKGIPKASEECSHCGAKQPEWRKHE